MRRIIATALLVIAFSFGCSAQATADIHAFDWLLGTWMGSGSGQPGGGTGFDSFTLGLNNQIVSRNSHSEYPATEKHEATVHDDFMVIYREDGAWRADYWDSESHVIHYAVTVGSGKAVFTSNPQKDGPRFRLSYERLSNGDLATVFAIASPGTDDFKPYVSGTSHRKDK